MAISNSQTQSKDIIFLQRDDTNRFYGETHISGSELIFYTDTDGYVNADKSASFYALFPPPEAGGLTPGNTYPITASWAESSSTAISASWAPGGTTLIDGATYNITSSWAISASHASESLSSSYSFTSSLAISASYASESLSASYSLSGSWADRTSTSSYSSTSSYINPSALSNLILPLDYKFSISVDSSDPGSGYFRLNNGNIEAATELYISDITYGGLDISEVWSHVSSGSTQIYIQQKDDPTRAGLFEVSDSSVDNTGWFTIPILYLSDVADLLPENNKLCSFVLINKFSIISASLYQITSSWAQTSSWALNAINGGTQLTTGSTYPITASWAETASFTFSSSYTYVDVLIYKESSSFASSSIFSETSISSSWASESFSSLYSSESLWSISASWATSSFTSSIAISSSWADTASWALNAINGGTSLSTGSNYPITTSWAINAITSISTLSASFASQSMSSSWAPTDPVYSASVSSQINNKQDILITGGTYTITSSWADSASWSTNAKTASKALMVSGIDLDQYDAYWMGGGRINGGIISTNTDGTINVTAGWGYKKTQTGSISQYPCNCIESAATSQNQYISWSAVTSMSVADKAYNFVYIDGTDNSVTYSTNFYSIDFYNDFTIGRVYRDSTTTTARLCGTNLFSFNRRVQFFGEEVFPVVRANGMIVAESGSRFITVTAGTLWAELVNRFTTTATNSGTTPFTYWWRVGSNFTSSAASQISNTQWNDITTGLASFGAGGNHWGVHWVYVVHDSSVHVIYGTSDYTTLASAQQSIAPSVLPGLVSAYATLVARIIIQKNATNFTEIDSAFDKVFATTTAVNHNDLGGIQGGTAGEYYHLTSAEYTGTGTGNFVRQSGATLNSAIISGSLFGSSSWSEQSNTASFLTRNRTYEITSSWAISSSWSPDQKPITASTLPITASWAETASVAISASWAPGGASGTTLFTGSTYPITSSWSEKSITADSALFILGNNVSGAVASASYSATASIAISASWAPSTGGPGGGTTLFTGSTYEITSSWAIYTVYATGSIESASFAQNAMSASWAPSSGGPSPSGPQGRVIVLCAGFNPSSTGADVAELPIPYNATDGTTPVSWSFRRFNFRVQTSGSLSSSVTFEKSTSSNEFVGSSVSTLILPSSSYESFTGSTETINSGDKLRFYVNDIGDSQYWTLTAEISDG